VAPENAHLCQLGTTDVKRFLITGDSDRGVIAPTLSSVLLARRFDAGYRLSLPPGCPLFFGVTPIGETKLKQHTSA